MAHEGGAAVAENNAQERSAQEQAYQTRLAAARSKWERMLAQDDGRYSSPTFTEDGYARRGVWSGVHIEDIDRRYLLWLLRENVDVVGRIEAELTRRGPATPGDHPANRLHRLAQRVIQSTMPKMPRLMLLTLLHSGKATWHVSDMADLMGASGATVRNAGAWLEEHGWLDRTQVAPGVYQYAVRTGVQAEGT